MFRGLVKAADARALAALGVCVALAVSSPAAASALTTINATALWTMDLTTYVDGLPYPAIPLMGQDIGPNSITLPEATFSTQSALSPDPSVQVATTIISPNDVNTAFETRASSRLQYDVRLTANDQADYDAMAASLAANQSPYGIGIGDTVGARISGTAGYDGAAPVYTAGGWTVSDGFVALFAAVSGEPYAQEPVFTNYYADCIGSSHQACSANYAFDLPIGLRVDQSAPLSFRGSVLLFTTVNLYRDGWGSAYVDPIISLFGTDPANWTLTLAPGVGNGDGIIPITAPPPAAPEPATWGLMLVGFGVMGGAMRSRRRMTGHP